MTNWCKNPLIYEINTWVWLTELSAQHGRPINLATVPQEVWDSIAGLGFDTVWLMGVWQRSPAGISIAQQSDGLLASFRQALPDFTEADNIGSPYCVRGYRVDDRLGGPEGLAVARSHLARRDMHLLLDFVPNHVAPDHPWVFEHPEYFIQGSVEDLQSDPGSFAEIADQVFACGRDPYFPAWPDVLQLNVFQPGLRRAVIATLKDIAEQCDGVRCDMAMLVMNTIFESTWGERAAPKPDRDYWPQMIAAIKQAYPDFKFFAEAYWDMEWELQQQGFDYCYDKRLYDCLLNEPADVVRQHLLADPAYQQKLVRFIENHDEPRVAAELPSAKERACAVAFSTLPGARLFHEGQLEGRQIRLPVFLGRRSSEHSDTEMEEFYQRLLKEIGNLAFQEGEWKLCSCSGWLDNQSFLNLVAWCWKGVQQRYVIVVNLSAVSSQGMMQLPWTDLSEGILPLTDVFTGEVFQRNSHELATGLFVALDPWQFHCLRLPA